MKLTTPRIVVSVVSSLVFGLAASGASAQQGGINVYSCGDLRPPGQYGPYDYRTISGATRHLVEDFHFTPSVEAGVKGNTSSYAGGDLDYTLRAFPNSPRALLAVTRYSTKEKAERAKGLRFSTECYFERAIRFVPDDPMPRLLYANYLKERKRTGEMRAQLDEAEKLRGDPTNFDFDYNLGLLYFEAGAYEKSMDAAERAYALGAPLPALMGKLKSVKKWREPRPAPVVEAPAVAQPPPTGNAPDQQ